jgi:CubicO group peptidase (beta-lactamase class C family)
MSRCHRIVAVAIILVLSVSCTDEDEPHGGVETGDDNAAVDAVFAIWNTPGSPGCALAVAQDGAPVYSRGYGFANLDYDIPITPQTVFDVASITKQFNAASLTMLAQEGKLSLDDNVRKWLPELPEYEWPITLRQMIYHTSGLGDYLTLFPLAGRNDYYPISHAQILAMMSRQRDLIFAPGEQHVYSNTAYMLLAQVHERASGQSLGAFAEERIFEPLGMQGSLMYDNHKKIIPRRATGYDRDGDGNVWTVHNYNFDVAGDGQMYSTVEDLLRWDNYLHGAEKPPIYRPMLTEGILNNDDPIAYAQGIFLSEYRGLRTVGHSGSSWGFRSQLVRFVEPGLSIAIACNADSARSGVLAQQVADHYLADLLGPESSDEEPGASKQDAVVPAEVSTLSSFELAEFAGNFFSMELDATYRFTVVDESLVVRIEQELPLAITPVAADQFEFKFHPQGWSGPETVSLAFDRDHDGAIIGFGLGAGSAQGIVFLKYQ